MYWFPSNGSLSRPLSLFVLGEVVWNRNRNRNKLINQIRAPGGHIQITIMIDTQPQYIKLNISGEISIIVVQTHSGRKRDIYAHKRTYTYSHIYEGGEWERTYTYIRWFITNLQVCGASFQKLTGKKQFGSKHTINIIPFGSQDTFYLLC
jgi:hypothetical protein